MNVIVNIREQGMAAIKRANDYFKAAGVGLSVNLMTREDYDGCVALSRNGKNPLPWGMARENMHDTDGVDFC
ncbi:hypothetical protein [Acerihabitans arboris]|uniref:Uncharacterized protein n=1 Tax=Acerihabitans arboris TaxID=2691583 RepID=A0A845SGC5_9GAMM|nr:hypothetical protein [Acerihabitans arboris]NDL61748.1 hypothetical protein [Acerihabitans arboris]